jgi:hypothetical protein
MARLSLIISFLLIIAIGAGIIFFGIPTSTAPVRVPAITVDLRGPNANTPNCDGAFTADVTVKATYPVVPGQNRIAANVTLSFNTTNIDSFRTIPANTQMTFQRDGRKIFAIEGTLKECAPADGTMTATATVTLPSQAGNHLPTTIAGGTITIKKSDIVVNAYPYQIYSDNNGVFIGDPPERIVTVKCCAAGNFHYLFPAGGVNQTNIDNVSADPDRFACAASDLKSSTINGKRDDPDWPGMFVTNIKKRGGDTCRVGRSLVE